jgi:hypothetical protein
MAFPKKRIIFFLYAALLLGASPALSVPLSSGVENQTATYGTVGFTDPDGETTLPVDGTADQASSEARSDIGSAGSPSMDMGHATPGWIVPAAAVGAGGGALFAFMSHDKGGNGSTSAGNGLGDPMSSSGMGGGITGTGTNNGTPGGSPSDVPEPGTILLMGTGIASFLGRRRVLSR